MKHCTRRKFLKAGMAASTLAGTIPIQAQTAKRSATDWVTLGKSGVKGEGTWKLSKDGFCTTWKGSKVSCFRVVPNGENKWSVMKGTVLAAVWTK